jgi:hypothetical protein
MAKQATALGIGGSDAWAFGPGTRPVPAESVQAVATPPVEEAPSPPSRARDYEQPAVFLSTPYAEPAVFLSDPAEPAAADRHMWDQLPTERGRRSRRYVGKHRA